MSTAGYDDAPFVVAWELTRSCAYACAHCRADAQPRRDSRELSTDEGRAVVDRLAAFDPSPILVLTGGDPLMRRDVFDLAAHATARGLRVSLTPTATALATPGRMRAAHEAGIRRVAFSVDAADPEVHDAFRGFRGSYERTLQGLRNAASEGMSLQVNTTVCRPNVDALPALVPALEAWGVTLWSVFVLVPTGRGATLPMLSATEHDRVMGWLCDLARRTPFDIKVTAAPQYRRVVAQRRGCAGPRHAADGLQRPIAAVNDGRGFMFISHIGEVMPSGFLPVSAGNVRRDDPVDLYRRSPLFRSLRDPGSLHGRCGRCEFREVCGGSRARAWAVTGDLFADDPACPHVPPDAEDGGA